MNYIQGMTHLQIWNQIIFSAVYKFSYQKDEDTIAKDATA